MKSILSAGLAAALLFGSSVNALAHFAMVIPSSPTIMTMSEADIDLDIKFWHPFDNAGMNMEKPAAFQVFSNGQATDLWPELVEKKVREFKTWGVNYSLKRPGLHVFALEPSPYWEPEEDKFIVHYTKAYVGAFGDDEGWEKAQGLKTEIVPLTNPAGLYAGGLFTGRVLLNGQPVPGSAVEVEWYPGADKRGQAPVESMITLSLAADDNGVFSFAVPAGHSGWWGFAALNEADFKLKHEGEDKDVELGGVVWVYFHDMKNAIPFAE